jgi:hypothetical protein
MNNFQYQNIDEILNSVIPIRGSRYNVPKDRRVIVPTLNVNDDLDNQILKDSFEMHLFYSDGGYVGSLYDIKNWTVDDENDPTEIYLNVNENLNNFTVQPGSYRIVYNFLRNYISSEFTATKLFIAEISNDRRELVLALTNPNDIVEVEKLKSFVLQYLSPKTYFPPIVLNFGENKLIDVINITSDGSETYFYVKLFYPLPIDLGLRYECWLGTQIFKPYIDTIKIQNQTVQTISPQNILRGPNYNVDYSFNTVSETDFKSWNDLLSTNLQTSQEILNKYVYGNTKPVRINIDFTDFNNFCFYSSAEERLENFIYKMKLIESYNEQIEKLMTYIGSYDEIDTNIINVKNLKEKLISGFDEWEKWLYYEQYNYDPFVIRENTITPYPKYEVTSNEDIKTKNGKFKFWNTSQGPGLLWYNSTLEYAKTFDQNNPNLLYKVFPSYVLENEEKEQFISFVNMIAQHFDIIYTYNEHILFKNLRKEDPNSGISQDLIQIATKNLGWNLSSNISDKELWEYALGLNNDTDPKYNILGEKYNKTEEERTKEVWRRILNNLPYIYGSKGTGRGIRALLAAYGIPQTLLTIREYGGAYNPNSYDLGKNLYEKSTYYLNFEGSLAGKNQKIELPWEKVNHYDEWKYPDTVTFRWKMQPEKIYNYQSNEIQTILQKSSSNGVDWFVTANKNGTDIEKGTLTFYLASGSTYLSASIYDEYIYEDIPLNIMIKRNISNDNNSLEQVYDFVLKTEKYGKIVIDRTESIFVNGALKPDYNNSWNRDGKLYIGSGSNFETNKILSGSVFEIRYWSNALQTSSFDNHVLAARSYNGNTPTSSFYDLQTQWKFWQYFDPNATSSIQSLHPNQKNNVFYSSPKVANFIGFTTGSFENFIETYFMDTANAGASTEYSQKIRIDSGSLSGALSVNNSYEKSSLEMTAPDSNRLMVAFSPQHIINEDIYEAIGNVDLTEYMGGYASLSEDSYPELTNFAYEYWQKYENRNDFNAYISLISQFDFSVFEQIRQTLPARTNEILGLVIEPNVLERSKVVSVKKVNGKLDGYVHESNVLSPYPNKIPAEYDSKSTVLFLGFEEGDLLDVNIIESETTVETIVKTETDENIKLGDVDVDLITKGKVNNLQKITLSKPIGNDPKLEFRTYNTLLKTKLIDDAISMQSISYDVKLNSKTYQKIIGETLDVSNYPKIDLLFNSSGSLAFIEKSTYNEISTYESHTYYSKITPKYKNNFIKNVGYYKYENAYYVSPKSFETAKQGREFFGCNDYPYPYKNSIKPELTLYTANSNLLNYALIRENYEFPKHNLNNLLFLIYNDVEHNSSTVESNIFPKSSFWKTQIRGGFFDDNDWSKNMYGMKDTAPRIIKLDTSIQATIPGSSTPQKIMKKLFTPQYLQESIIAGTKNYLNYPTSQDHIRGFPWVLWWKGDNDTIPNLGPSLGFGSSFYVTSLQPIIGPSINQ